MRQTTIKELKPGDFFTLKPIEEPTDSQVWVRDQYDRSSKKYDVYKWSDINHFSQRKGNTKVWTDFTF